MRLLRVIIEDADTGRALLQATLPIDAGASILSLMSPSPHRAGGATAAPDDRVTINPPDSGPVAGRIERHESELDAVVREWIARNAQDWAASTAKEYRGVLRKAIRECGWSRCADVTMSAVTEYLDGKRASGQWIGATYNRNLGAFKSLTKYMAMRELLARNPLEHAEGVSQRDSKSGARAATTDEIRSLVKLAWARESTDKRAKGNRALHRAMLALGGMRFEEPFLFRWRNYRRVDGVPVFWWQPDMQKNGREAFIAVAPELVELLEEHRARMLASGVTETITIDRRNNTRDVRRCDPNDPDGFILPYTSSTSRFSKDVEGSDVQRYDWRGRRFSSHAFRKWFETTLVDAGVQQRQVDFLIRHHVDVASRYYDMPLDAQVLALSRLPRVWPGNYADSIDGAEEKKVQADSSEGLTGPTDELILQHLLDAANRNSGPPNGEVSSRPDEQSCPSCGCATRGTNDAGPRPASSKPATRLESDMGYFQTQLTGLDRDALADMLDAVARLLREPKRDHRHKSA